MTAAVWVEMRQALAGSLRLARGDRTALACFDRSLEGFWHSFRAALISYPLYLILVLLRVSAAEWDASGAFRILAVETIAFVISWVAFALIMLPLARWLDREERYFDFMVPYNWCQVPETVLFVAIGMEGATGLLPLAASGFVEFAAALAVLAYEWYIARVTLAAGGAAATVVVLVNLVLGLFVSRVADSLY
ncbi:MAG: hypothetical protein JO038_08790 [Alphaproteobacteria bacterium]|nr:hypothetical protein [Alphaproteobacteria bacterium]